MEKRINIAEILKDCPNGMELDCTIWENVVFDYIDMKSDYPIHIKKMGGEKDYLTKDGHFNFDLGAKCVIFPKGKTTWEGFQRPFKDGDVCTGKVNGNLVIFIYKNRINTTLVKSHFVLYVHVGVCKNCCIALKDEEIKFATEEEKQELFKAIQDNGYHWNDETKTLEILIKPKFKIGDRIRHKLTGNVYEVSSFLSNGYGSGVYEIGIINELIVKIIDIKEQDNYELLPNKFDITTLKPFDKVLVRTNKFDPIWTIDFYDGYRPKRGGSFTPFAVTGSKYFQQCIPYEGNEHLLGTTNDCDEFYKNW